MTTEVKTKTVSGKIVSLFQTLLKKSTGQSAILALSQTLKFTTTYILGIIHFVFLKGKKKRVLAIKSKLSALGALKSSHFFQMWFLDNKGHLPFVM